MLAFNVLTLLVGRQEGHPACKNWVIRCWHGSVWDEVHVCIWPGWCHCHSPSLAPVNPDWFYLLLTRVVPDKGPLSGWCCAHPLYLASVTVWFYSNVPVVWNLKVKINIGSVILCIFLWHNMIFYIRQFHILHFHQCWWIHEVGCCDMLLYWISLYQMPSMLWCCQLGGRKVIWPVNNWVAGCWHGYLSGARWRSACGLADATATHYLFLQ